MTESGVPAKGAAGFEAYKPSAIFLIAANALPLIGVLFWGWNAFTVVALYWMENEDSADLG